MAQPEKIFRIGACSAAVFVNAVVRDDSDMPRSFRTVSLQRRYRDGDDWKTATSFTLADLPVAMTVLRLALDYVASREASGGSST